MSEDAERYELVAKLAKRDSVKYVIHLLPGRHLEAQCFAEQMLAMVQLLRSCADRVGGADLVCMLTGLELVDTEIRVTLTLMHTAKGEFIPEPSTPSNPEKVEAEG